MQAVCHTPCRRSESSSAGLIPAQYHTASEANPSAASPSFSASEAGPSAPRAPNPYGPPPSARAHLVPKGHVPQGGPRGVESQGSGQPLLEETSPLKRTGLMAGGHSKEKKVGLLLARCWKREAATDCRESYQALVREGLAQCSRLSLPG